MENEIKNQTEEGVGSLKIEEPSNPLPDFKFEDLDPRLKEAVKKLGWDDLMLVQKKAMPYMMNAEDLIVQSKTGSGKTGAFALPLSQIIETSVNLTQAMVLVPTRELAVQVHDEFQKLASSMGVRCTAIYGGVGYQAQLDALKEGAHIVVGTPGRILDHLAKGHLVLDNLRDLVLDEADEMLSMGFYPDMKKISQYMPKDRCSYLFSATMPTTVKSLAMQFLRNPRELNLCTSSSTVAKMDRIFYKIKAMDKDQALLNILEIENPESAIIFCNTKKDVHYLYEFLSNRGILVGELSGDITQSLRERTLKSIKDQKIRFLVATDVAARGIDIQGLSHVILYDHPADNETYVHRSGRTARAGNQGKAISLITDIEEISLNRVAENYEITFIKKEYGIITNGIIEVSMSCRQYFNHIFFDKCIIAIFRISN